MPATLNSTVGSCGIRLADGTGVWPRAAKKSRNDWRSSSAVRGGRHSPDRAYLWAAIRGRRPNSVTAAMATPPDDGPQDLHEWISFEDPTEQRTWVFDATFLRSNYRCIYGAGCPGILDAPAPELEQGCCSLRRPLRRRRRRRQRRQGVRAPDAASRCSSTPRPRGAGSCGPASPATTASSRP